MTQFNPDDGSKVSKANFYSIIFTQENMENNFTSAVNTTAVLAKNDSILSSNEMAQNATIGQIPQIHLVQNITIFQEPQKSESIQEAVFTNRNETDYEMVVVRLSMTAGENPTTAKIYIVPETTTESTNWKVKKQK